MAEAKAKRVQIATTVDSELAEALQAIRWDNRIEKLSDVIRDAVTDYVAKHGKVAPVVTSK